MKNILYIDVDEVIKSKIKALGQNLHLSQTKVVVKLLEYCLQMSYEELVNIIIGGKKG